MPSRTSVEELFKSAEKEWLDRYKKGPMRTRLDKLPLQEGDSAPDFKLKDHAGKTRRLSEFWKDKPALILFWRQFGCGCGIGRAERLRNEYHDFLRAAPRLSKWVKVSLREQRFTRRNILSVPDPI